jgi:hypothetical protein
MTRARGKVIDASTGEPLPFAAVAFKGKNIGTSTDFSGEFFLESGFASNILVITSLGYEKKEVLIKLATNNYGLVIRLKPNNIQLEEVEIVSEKKRKKYRNKGNPAVMLIREVIKNRDKNKISSLDSYSIDRYRKIGFDINNITERFTKNPLFKNIQEIFDFVDTSEVNGKPFLPVYINESIARIYEQKKPAKRKEIVLAEHFIGFEELVDGEGVASMMSVIYKEIDIYEGNISFLRKDFVSPISSIAPSVYRYYIMDTVIIEETKTVELGFIPRNDAANAFRGKIWVSLDSTYAVKKVVLRKMDKMNLNWVNTFLIELNFSKFEGLGMFLTESHSTIDFNMEATGVGAGIYGKNSFYYRNLKSNIEIPDSILSMTEEMQKIAGYNDKGNEFWENERYAQLTEGEGQIKIMSDHMQELPAFKTFYTIIKLFLDGYWDFGKISVGPVGSLFSFNEIEGARLHLGLRTTEKLSYHWEGEASGAYGFNDKEWKYGARLRHYWSREKRNYINMQFRRDYEFPGTQDASLSGGNFFVSFKRGALDKMIDFRNFETDFSWELGNDFQSILKTKVSEQRGLGSLDFLKVENGEIEVISKFNTWEIGFKQRWSPNQKYYQGDYFRSQITTKHPIFELNYTYGQSYDPSYTFQYHKLNFRFYKRNTMGILGFNDIFLEAEKTFGNGVPFLFMKMHTANQTYTFESYGANMMNYLEFVSDEYVYLIFTHYFGGLFFNQIPLFKRLKWRSIISAKFLYGGVTNANDPKETDGLIQFPTDIYGNPSTFSLEEEPYVELSVGIENIFNLIRIDLVKRMTYLDHPNIPDVGGVKGLGLRFSFKIKF